MTPDLILRTRSQDEAVAEPAAAEWDRQGEEYRKRLESIRPGLPAGARKLLRRYPLHDAKVLTIAADKGSHLSIFLETEAPLDQRDKHVELRYRLAGGLG